MSGTMQSVRFDAITGVDPKNNREKYTGIEELATDIARVGLIQNLVLFEHEKGKYLVRAGSRRYLAIKLLIERDIWPIDRLITANIITFLETDIGTSENVHRVNLTPWEIGKKAHELSEEGYTQEQIAGRLGSNQRSVSKYLAIHRGLHPRIRKAMVNLLPQCMTFDQVYKVSCLIDPVTEEPDEDLQLSTMARMLGQPKHSSRSPKKKAERQRIIERVRHLETAVVPIHAQPYLKTIVDYIAGKKKRLSFGRA